jgi:hypothetical protein
MHPDNINNPYGYQVGDEDMGMTSYYAPQSNSTMTSDCIEMVKRLKRFVPESNVQKGRKPTNNIGSNYKLK